MMTRYLPTPFASAGQAFAEALPPSSADDEDEPQKIVLPSRRYDEIDEAVLRMYEKAEATRIPLPVLDVVIGLGYSVIPYRSFGPRISEVLQQASKDAVSLSFFGGARPAILYNDRMPAKRVNFSLLHEVGHLELGHKEPSKLAEIEANHFAAVALCPVEFLEHYRFSDVDKVAKVFNISDECARHRLQSMANRRGIRISSRRQEFRRAIVERFRFEKSIQRDLFGNWTF